MITVFADTRFFQAVLSLHDEHHAEVMAFLETRYDFIVTTRWVLAETANAASGSAYRNEAARFLQAAESDPSLMIAAPSDELYRQGLDLYAKRPDKSWSLTDCISFVVMQDANIQDALTGDHHFAQAGFRPLFVK